MNLTMQDVIVRPIISEKAERGREASGVRLPGRPRGHQDPGEGCGGELFTVKVTGVRTSIARGKTSASAATSAAVPNWKKAIVTLKEGDTIALFEGK